MLLHGITRTIKTSQLRDIMNRLRNIPRRISFPVQQRVIQHNLTNLGLLYSFATYIAGRRGVSIFAGQGIVFILGILQLYVEHKVSQQRFNGLLRLSQMLQHPIRLLPPTGLLLHKCFTIRLPRRKRFPSQNQPGVFLYPAI